VTEGLLIETCRCYPRRQALLARTTRRGTLTAALMVLMITPALDEVIAMFQFLLTARREGQPLWRAFWLGGTLKGRHEEPQRRESTAMQIIQAMDLDNVPWNLIAATALGVWLMFTPTALGVWLMFTPTALGFTGAVADSHHLVGALVVTCSVIAFGEPARSVRFLNVLMGPWVAAAPWMLSGATSGARWNALIVGAALVLLSFRRGSVRERFGGWNRYVR
jgi:hypothetical protein